MFIITVIPIAKGPLKDELSYFSASSYEPGMVIKVPLRKKEVRALVLKSTSVTSSKAEVKKLQFELKKLPTQFPITTLPHALIQAAQDTAEFYATTTGAVIDAVLPSFASDAYPQADATVQHRSTTHYCLQAYPKDRYEKYKNIVREAFAKNESVFIACAHKARINEVKEALQSGIEEHVFTLSSNLTKKKQLSTWQTICEHTHPLVVIATPHFIALPRYDFSLFIIDEENSDTYILQHRPFIDLRYFIKRYAFHSLASVVFADTLLRIETYHLLKEKVITQYRPFSLMYRDDIQTHILDMTKVPSPKRGELALFSPEVIEILQQLKSRHEKVLLYVSRKGTYPLTQCDDCGSIVSCHTCGYPLVLYKHEHRTVYACHVCNKYYETDIRCEKCDGWRLSTLGIGINLVQQHLQKDFPTLFLSTIDGTTIKKEKEVSLLLEEFKRSDHGILLTTQKGLPYISSVFDSVIVVSIDPLFAIPDLRMNERIMKLLTDLKSHARRHYIVQTRHGHTSLIRKALEGDTEHFFEEELRERFSFDMPPATRLIKISWTGTSDALKKGKLAITTLFESYSPEFYASFFKTPKGHSILNALIKVPRSAWPDPHILEKIKSLPPSILVQIEPNTLL